ncbi:MAG: CAP domain-containing protein [Actinomycetota bacterium]
MITPRTRPRLAASLLLLTLVGAAFVAPSADAGARRAPRPTADELGQRMLRLVNRSREIRGLPELRMNAHLSAEALRHSRRMARAGTISHTPNLADLVRGVGGSVFGEDLGKGRGLQGIRDAWLRRADTRRIMLDPRFRHVGLGVVHVDGFYWVTLQAFD